MLLVTEVLPLFVLVLVPISVHAGVFSSLSQIWLEPEQETYVEEAVDYSALYTPLLSASVNSVANSKRAIGGGDITVEDGALVSTGPVAEDEIAAAGTNSGEISVYVVREGDALSQIAEMYGVTTNTILWANDLQKASDIHPGDSLVILPVEGVKHTVQKGQTLASIVKKYEGDIDEVLAFNNLDSADSISVGDEIIIPGGKLHQKKAQKRVSKRTYPAPTKSTGSVATAGYFTNPAPGSIRTQGYHGYNAVDLASRGGAAIPIVAAAAGEVVVSKASGWNGGYGTYVVIRHNNGTQTLYAHMSANYVARGQYVAKGQQIGRMGNTGKSTGVHLHFEVRGGRNPF